MAVEAVALALPGGDQERFRVGGVHLELDHARVAVDEKHPLSRSCRRPWSCTSHALRWGRRACPAPPHKRCRDFSDGRRFGRSGRSSSAPCSSRSCRRRWTCRRRRRRRRSCAGCSRRCRPRRCSGRWERRRRRRSRHGRFAVELMLEGNPVVGRLEQAARGGGDPVGGGVGLEDGKSDDPAAHRGGADAAPLQRLDPVGGQGLLGRGLRRGVGRRAGLFEAGELLLQLGDLLLDLGDLFFTAEFPGRSRGGRADKGQGRGRPTPAGPSAQPGERRCASERWKQWIDVGSRAASRRRDEEKTDGGVPANQPPKGRTSCAIGPSVCEDSEVAADFHQESRRSRGKRRRTAQQERTCRRFDLPGSRVAIVARGGIFARSLLEVAVMSELAKPFVSACLEMGRAGWAAFPVRCSSSSSWSW